MKTKDMYECHHAHDKWVDGTGRTLWRRWLKRYDVHHMDDALHLLADVRGGAFLDIGCGKGGLLSKVAGQFDTLVGVDVSDVVVGYAKKALVQYTNVTVEAQDVDAGLSFADSSFDAVTSTQCLEHVVDVFGALREINRVLRMGGCLVASVPNIAYVKYRWALLRGRLPVTSADDWSRVGWDGGHLHYFTHRTFEKALAYCGFRLVKVSGSGLLAGFRRWWPSLLIGDVSVRAQKVSHVTRDQRFSLD